MSADTPTPLDPTVDGLREILFNNSCKYGLVPEDVGAIQQAIIRLTTLTADLAAEKQHRADAVQQWNNWEKLADERLADLAACRKDKEGVEAELVRVKEGLKQAAEIFGEKAGAASAIIDGRAIPLTPYLDTIDRLRAQLAQATRDGVAANDNLLFAVDRWNIASKEVEVAKSLMTDEARQEWSKRMFAWVTTRKALTPPPSAGTNKD